MSQLPWGILASSAAGLSITATGATLTADTSYYYLTFINSTNAIGAGTATMTVGGGQVPFDYLIVAGGGGSAGNMMIGSQYVQWNCYYHSYYCDYWGEYCWYGDYYCDNWQYVNIYRGAGAGAGGVITGNMTLNPGVYNILVGAGGKKLQQAPFASRGEDSFAFGLTAIGGGAGIPLGFGSDGDTTIRAGGSGGAGGSGTVNQGNQGAINNFVGVTGSNPYTSFNANMNCNQLASNGYLNSYSLGNCFESAGTGGGPLSPGVGHGISTIKATNVEPLGSQYGNEVPSSLSSGLTALGLTVGFPGLSTDMYGSVASTSPAANTGSGGGTNQNSSPDGKAGVIRIRIAKSAMVDVKVV